MQAKARKKRIEHTVEEYNKYQKEEEEEKLI